LADHATVLKLGVARIQVIEGVTVRAACLSRIPRWAAGAAQDILAARHRLQMRRIYTSPVPAKMVKI
jgi:hypothetical protein